MVSGHWETPIDQMTTSLNQVCRVIYYERSDPRYLSISYGNLTVWHWMVSDVWVKQTVAYYERSAGKSEDNWSV